MFAGGARWLTIERGAPERGYTQTDSTLYPVTLGLAGNKRSSLLCRCMNNSRKEFLRICYRSNFLQAISSIEMKLKTFFFHNVANFFFFFHNFFFFAEKLSGSVLEEKKTFFRSVFLLKVVQFLNHFKRKKLINFFTKYRTILNSIKTALQKKHNMLV
jgi:hypothetical protein